MHRIIAISNRVPALDNLDACSGGLAVDHNATLDEAGGLWLGWSGRIAQSADDMPNMQPAGAFTLATLDLTQAEHSGYYLGFANRILWPLLNGRSDLARFDPLHLFGAWAMEATAVTAGAEIASLVITMANSLRRAHRPCIALSWEPRSGWESASASPPRGH